ncbi:MAG: hypothetical protein M3N16_00785 [Actinomycetota bacterium]|nr:hypothetical protein [Actinomycetota bacterium]
MAAQTDRGDRLAFAVGGLAVGLAVGLVVGVLLFDGDSVEAEAPTADLVSRIAADPSDYFGEDVQVGGEVSEVLGPRTFLIGGEEFGSGDALLVVTREPVTTPRGRAPSAPVLENDLVFASGEVHAFFPEELEEELGAQFKSELDVYLNDDLRERRGDPVVVADSFSSLPRLFPVRPASSPQQVVDQAVQYFGKVTSVSGRVTDLREGALVLDDSLLVLMPPRVARRWSVGDRVRVLGAVRRFDRDQARAGRSDLDSPFFGVFADKPALVAESIEISEGS